MTKADREWFEKITALGCIVCRLRGAGYVPCQRHHILKGGRRISHLASIPLCQPHHQGGRNDEAIVSRHPWKREFEARYGSEEYLLERTKEFLGELQCP